MKRCTVTSACSPRVEINGTSPQNCKLHWLIGCWRRNTQTGQNWTPVYVNMMRILKDEINLCRSDCGEVSASSIRLCYFPPLSLALSLSPFWCSALDTHREKNAVSDVCGETMSLRTCAPGYRCHNNTVSIKPVQPHVSSCGMLPPATTKKNIQYPAVFFCSIIGHWGT